MYKFIIKRILFLIPTIIGVTFIIYAVMNITPGDPGRAILGTGVSQADIDAYNHALGYDLPFLQKFGLYIKRMVIDQDFGISYVTKQNAFHEIWPRFLVTLKLSFLGVFLSAIIGIPLGIQAAVKQYKLADTIPSLLAFLLAAVPTFVLGLAMLFLFCDRLNWLPSYGISIPSNTISCRRWPFRFRRRRRISASPNPPCWRLSVRTMSARPAPRACRSAP